MFLLLRVFHGLFVKEPLFEPILYFPYRLLHQPIQFLLGFVDFIKRMIRPGLTIYLVGLTTWITIVARDVLVKANENDLTAIQAKEIFDSVTTIIIYLTVTCVTWWFGDRRMSKFLMRLNDGNIKDSKQIK